jgi:hypothetical protein
VAGIVLCGAAFYGCILFQHGKSCFKELLLPCEIHLLMLGPFVERHLGGRAWTTGAVESILLPARPCKGLVLRRRPEEADRGQAEPSLRAWEAPGSQAPSNLLPELIRRMQTGRAAAAPFGRAQFRKRLELGGSEVLHGRRGFKGSGAPLEHVSSRFPGKACFCARGGLLARVVRESARTQEAPA